LFFSSLYYNLIFIQYIGASLTFIIIANIRFAYWDRRTIIRRAKKEAIAEIKKREK